MAVPNCTCRVCGKTFHRTPAQLANGAGNYCSRACRGIAFSEIRRQPDTHIAKTCERCGKDFTMPRAWIKRGGQNSGRFCSLACRDVPQYGMRTMRDDGYVAICCDDGVWRLEHRVVAEHMLGRPLLEGETVHHRNKDRADNHPDNLDVLTRSGHQRMHHKERYPLAKGAWGPGREQCAECKTTSTPYKAFGLCISCYSRKRTLERNPNAGTRAARRAP